jgi:hypothetical protein
MPVHKVTVGQKIDDMIYVKKQTQETSNQVPAPPSLDFSRGIKFEIDIKSKFGHSVNFVPGFQKREFLLVISFGRATFKLNSHTVGLSLQSCFGGIASKFHVVCLKERVFRFSVASRSVGFEIYNSGKLSEKDFDCFIHLWGNGGPNWF